MLDMDIQKIKSEIIERLKPLNPNKIILFGSYAYGTQNNDSDIDLYVVTNDEFMPQNWREKMQIKLKFSKALRDIFVFVTYPLTIKIINMDI